MKDVILICERKVGELLLRGYRIHAHYVVAVNGLEGSGPDPKRLVFEGFDDLNRSWANFQNLEEAALRSDLAARTEGMQPRLPRIQRNPNRNRDEERPSRPSRQPERPFRSGERFERNDDPARPRPRIERPRRLNPDS